MINSSLPTVSSAVIVTPAAMLVLVPKRAISRSSLVLHVENRGMARSASSTSFGMVRATRYLPCPWAKDLLP